MSTFVGYAVLRVVLSMIALLPLRGESDLLFRWDIAHAIVTVTDDPIEQNTLTLIARRESGFRQNVARCERRGDNGKSRGTYQIQPMASADASNACGTPIEQADLALRYVRRSADACPGNVGPDTLAMYVSGTCTRGLREARERWGGEIHER